MNWLDAIRDFFGSKDDFDERPSTSSDRFGSTEVLECRLVLGALSTETSLLSSGTANPTSESQVSTGNIVSTTDASSLSPQTASSTTNSLMAQSTADMSSTNSADFSGPSDDTVSLKASGHSLTTISSVDVSTDTPISANTLSVGVSTDAPADSTSPSTFGHSVLATQSTPLETVDTSSVQSPPVAFDNSLTAINRNVMVPSSMISGSGEVSANSGSAASSSSGDVSTTSALLALNDQVAIPTWFSDPSAVTTIHYDFRDQNGVTNTISTKQIVDAEQVLSSWSQASGGRVQFVRDTQAALSDVVNIGVGDLSAVRSATSDATTLGTSTHALVSVDGNATSVGSIWLNGSQNWNNGLTPGGSSSSYDFNTVLAHEAGHILGMEDDSSQPGIMNPTYSTPQDLSGVSTAWANPTFFMSNPEDADGFITDNMGNPQLTATEVQTLLSRAAVALPEDDAIIAVVDRTGTILGVRVEQGVLNTISDPTTLAFAIDGAVSKARTAAFFSNDSAAITSRTIEGLSQTTILQREVEANPNSSDATIQGPGFIAPIGLGGHFPAGIENTPPVDLFNIEASNRDSIVVPGTDRFNIDPANVPAGQSMTTPISYGTDAGIPGDSQNRGIATLPGGVPIFRDPNGNGDGATLIGGIGVFFPGADGFATHEQGFVPGVGQSEFQRMNTTQELEAEFIGLAAVGGSPEALRAGVSNAVVGTIGGIAPVQGADVLFANITLKGILLPGLGSTPGKRGIEDLIAQFGAQLGTGADSGTNQTLGGGVTSRAGQAAPDGWLVTPHTSANSTLTVADMNQIIDAGIAAAYRVRATLRPQANLDTGQQNVRMTFAISDTQGNILAMYRMPDSTVFSEDVAVAKARNVAYFNDPAQLQSQDQVATITGQPQVIAPGTSFTSRTFRFLAEPRFPAGVDDSVPPQFSILNDAAAAGIDPETGENIAAPGLASDFTTVMGHDVFNVGTNFHDTSSPAANQNGIIFFPGSTSLYKNGQMVGGLGVSGDGVNQDDVVTFLSAQGYLPDPVATPNALPADYVGVDGVRLPYFNFTRNPFG